MSTQIANFLEIAVRAQANIVVSGGTGSGKTTLLNVLTEFIPEGKNPHHRGLCRTENPEGACCPPRIPPAELKGKGAIKPDVRVRRRMPFVSAPTGSIVIGECG